MIFLQNQWSMVFAGMVSRAMTLAVLSTGVAGNYNGALQVVNFGFLFSSCNIVNLELKQPLCFVR